MITYNIRYRGPFEYEKFILNIMQNYNETKTLIEDFTHYKESTIDDLQNKVNTLFKKSIQPNNMSEQLLTLRLLKG